MRQPRDQKGTGWPIWMSAERNEYGDRFEDVVHRAQEILRRDGHHVPILIVEGSRGRIISPVPEMPRGHAERVKVMEGLGRAAAGTGGVGELRQVFMIAEGWMSAPEPGRSLQYPPSDDPNRKEVLLISGLEPKGGRKRLKLFEIVRGEQGRVIGLQEVVGGGDAEWDVQVPLLQAFSHAFQAIFRAKAN